MRQNDSSDLLSDDDKPDYQQIMKDQLTASKKLIGKKYPPPAPDLITAAIKSVMQYREDKIFTMHAPQPRDFFVTQWNFVTKNLPVAPLDFKNIIIASLNKRLRNVTKEILQQKLIVEQHKILNVYSYDIDEKIGKMHMLKGQSQQIKRKLLQINNSLQSIDGESQEGPVATNTQNKDMFAHLYTEQKKKEVQAFLRKKKQEKQQRKKRLQLQKQKQEQELLEKEKQMKEIQQRQQRLKKEQFLKKNMELHQKRNQQKALREQKSEEYEQHIKSLNQKPRLFQLLQKNFEKKVEYQQMEKRHRILSERKSRYLNIDQLKIEEHQKNYEELKKMKAQQRQKKQQELLDELNKNHVKHHSSFELTRQVDKDLEEKQKAKEKFEKIKHYQSIVKQKYKPKVDQEKKKQMLTLIEQLELNSKKKLKKTKLENGTVVYQEIRQSDPRKMGIMYLQMTKQMAAKAKMNRAASSSVQIQSAVPPKKKPLNYLEQLRSKPRTVRKLSFTDRPNMSFDDKINNVLIQSQRLNDLVKQNEMKLKYGKFKTSEQILNCKQEIDQSYLNIAKMKLKLIKDQ